MLFWEYVFKNHGVLVCECGILGVHSEDWQAIHDFDTMYSRMLAEAHLSDSIRVLSLCESRSRLVAACSRLQVRDISVRDFEVAVVAVLIPVAFP